MKFRASKLQGCYEIFPKIFTDNRGSLVKTFHEPTFIKKKLFVGFKECFYSTSKKGVLRGMHFQLPPHDHSKMVYVVAGQVMDVVLDLRIGSPSFGQYDVFELSYKVGNMAYIPIGVAHGYLVLSDEATVVYQTGTVHNVGCDAGIRWDSFGVDWPETNVLMSERDWSFPRMQEFRSPFMFIQED